MKSLVGSIDKVTQVILNESRSLVRENCERKKHLAWKSTTEKRKAEEEGIEEEKREKE